jgi:hypothetical protein
MTRPVNSATSVLSAWADFIAERIVCWYLTLLTWDGMSHSGALKTLYDVFRRSLPPSICTMSSTLSALSEERISKSVKEMSVVRSTSMMGGSTV